MFICWSVLYVQFAFFGACYYCLVVGWFAFVDDELAAPSPDASVFILDLASKKNIHESKRTQIVSDGASGENHSRKTKG